MSNPNFIINDSEAESDGGIADETQFHSAEVAPIPPGPSYEPSGYQTLPASGEIRRKEIDEAHAALLSTGTLDSPTPADPPSANPKAKRRQTTHGRLEGSREQDVYSFNASEGEDFNPGSESKKRKRPSSEKKPTRKKRDGEDEDSDYGEGARSSKKTAKRSKSAGLAVIDLLNDSSGDDWQPNAAKLITSGKKSTRNNTSDAELLAPLPKHKRKPRESTKTTTYYDPQQIDGNLTLEFSSVDTHSAEVQVAGTGLIPPTPQNFMVDLTKNDLILPSERRAEYDPISPGYSADELPVNLPGTNGVYNTPDLRSTIPDPPNDPSLLPSQAMIQQLNSHTAEIAPLATTSVASDSPLSSLQNSPPREVPVAKKPRKEKKRAATDNFLEFSEDNGFGSFPIASEWRAAKGKARQGIAQATPAVRSKTLNDLDAESDGDDTWAGDGKVAKKKKKPAAKKRKSTVNEDSIGEGGETQKPKPKRKKGKPIETLVITDSEDELSGPGIGRSGTIQVAGTADMIAPANNPNSKLSVNTLNLPLASTNDLLGTIAVGNALPDEDHLLSEQKQPKAKKLHKWQQLTKNTVADGEDSAPPETSVVKDTLPSPIAETEPEMQEPTTKTIKKQTTAQRRKSKKDESEEEDWTGDPEPAKKKKEVKPKTPRVTKKAAAAAAAKEAKEQVISSAETVKASDEEDNLSLVAIVEPDPIPTLDRKAPAKKEPKLSKAAAAKKAKAQREKEKAEVETEGSAAGDDEKKVTPTPTLEAKPEPPPQTPSKKLTEKAKTPHSPINKGPVKFRVGLSRRAHIEPLLKIVRK